MGTDTGLGKTVQLVLVIPNVVNTKIESKRLLATSQLVVTIVFSSQQPQRISSLYTFFLQI